MNLSFKNAIAISILVHSIAILPASSISLKGHHRENTRPITIDYIRLKEPLRVEREKKGDAKTIETAKLEMAKPVDLKPSISAARDAAKKALAAGDEIQAIAKKEAQIRSTRDYINYYQLIREKIRQRLKAKYRNYDKEGDAYIVFTLNADGSLAGIDIERASSTTDTRLLDMATSSVKEASPFPPFPKILSLPRMYFNVVISFKRE